MAVNLILEYVNVEKEKVVVQMAIVVVKKVIVEKLQIIVICQKDVNLNLELVNVVK